MNRLTAGAFCLKYAIGRRVGVYWRYRDLTLPAVKGGSVSLTDVLSVVISVLALAVALGGLIASLAENAQMKSQLRRDKAEQVVTAFLRPLRDLQKTTETIYDDLVRMTRQDAFEHVPTSIHRSLNQRPPPEWERKHWFARLRSTIDKNIQTAK
jgi:hypothetical protein